MRGQYDPQCHQQQLAWSETVTRIRKHVVMSVNFGFTMLPTKLGGPLQLVERRSDVFERRTVTVVTHLFAFSHDQSPKTTLSIHTMQTLKPLGTTPILFVSKFC